MFSGQILPIQIILETLSLWYTYRGIYMWCFDACIRVHESWKFPRDREILIETRYIYFDD